MTPNVSDPSLDLFAQATKLFGEKDLAGAAGLFEKVIEESDGKHLRDRARQYLSMCRRYADAGGPIEDNYLAAVYEKNRGDLEKALEICQQGSDDDERFVYLKASLKVLLGDEEQALQYLEKAIALEPKNRVHAFHDPDFESLRGSEGFTALINPPKAEAS